MDKRRSFIYVFDVESKDKLIKNGYKLLKEDRRNGMYIFVGKDTVPELEDTKYILSNILTFDTSDPCM